MLFSIICPTYNSSKTIVRAVDSIFSQTIDNCLFELIIIDDGSTDNTVKLVSKYLMYNNVFIINQNHFGPLSSRIEGIKKAQGEYILFLDSDDYYENTALEQINKVISFFHFDIILYNYYYTTTNRKEEINAYFLNKPSSLIELKKQLLEGHINVLWNKCIKREMFNYSIHNIKTTNNIYCEEDLLLLLAAFDKVKTFTFLDKFLYNYVLSNSSISHSIADINNTDKYYNKEALTTTLFYSKKWRLEECEDAIILLKVRQLFDLISSLFYSYNWRNNKSFLKKNKLVDDDMKDLFLQSIKRNKYKLPKKVIITTKSVIKNNFTMLFLIHYLAKVKLFLTKQKNHKKYNEAI